MMNFEDYQSKVGLVVKQLFTGKVSDTYGATRVSSSIHRKSIEMVVIHTTANTATAFQEASNIANNNGINSFNAVADANEVYETVRFSDVAHHAGDKDINQRSIGVELSELNIEEGYSNLVKYLGYAMADLGLKPSQQTIRLHGEFANTSCGSFYKKIGINKIVSDVMAYYEIAISEGWNVKPQPKPDPEPKPDGSFAVGDVVTIANHATHYATGQAIPDSYIGHSDVVMEVGDDRVLLTNIYSWVLKKDLVGGTQTAPEEPNKSNGVSVGSMATINSNAQMWATGQVMDEWVKGKQFKVLEIRGDEALLDGVMSWAFITNLNGGGNVGASKPTNSNVLSLTNEPLYSTSTSSEVLNRLTGTYYKWDDQVINGRIRITNSINRIGVEGQVTGFIKA